MENYLSTTKVALLLGTSVQTIQRWYYWYENPEYDHKDLVLPQYYYLDGRQTKYFLNEDLEVFRKFQKQLQSTHKGIMADFNAKFQWGNRGKEIAKRKEDVNEQSKVKN